MLVLTRKTNQSIMIGDDVEISVLAVTGDKVRIGISAPREIGVFRTEIYSSIDGDGAADGRAAADGSSADGDGTAADRAASEAAQSGAADA